MSNSSDLKVAKLNVVPLVPGEPNKMVIDILREVLREAKEGKIQAIGIAVACIDPNGDGGRSTETILSAADGWYHSLACAVGGLTFRLNYERYTAGRQLTPIKPKDEDE